MNDRFVDRLEEGYDFALRIGDLRDSSLVARRIAPCRAVLCASPAYLDRRGRPARPEQPAGHDCLLYANTVNPRDWTLNGPAGREAVAVAGPRIANHGDLLCAAALDGLGPPTLPDRK